MTEDQFKKLEDFIQAKIEAAQHNNSINEAVRLIDCRKDLREALGLPTYPPKS